MHFHVTSFILFDALSQWARLILTLYAFLLACDGFKEKPWTHAHANNAHMPHSPQLVVYGLGFRVPFKGTHFTTTPPTHISRGTIQDNTLKSIPLHITLTKVSSKNFHGP
jgi:hypothetical protein